MGKIKEFLKRKDVVFSAHRYGIDAWALWLRACLPVY
mgnify:CR=1 FL=1